MNKYYLICIFIIFAYKILKVKYDKKIKMQKKHFAFLFGFINIYSLFIFVIQVFFQVLTRVTILKF